MPKVRCSSCGTIFDASRNERNMKCPSCGKVYKNPSYVEPADNDEKAVVTRYVEQTDGDLQTVAKESKFTGTAGSYLGLMITNFLLILVTLTVFTPWAICRTYRWQISHKVIDGKRLSFDGKGGHLAGKYWWWAFLSVITLGIYGLWVPKKLQEWLNSHTYIEGAHRDQTSFDGGVGKYLGIGITNCLLDIITLGFYAAWGHCRVLRWQIDNSVIEGHRMRFDGKGGQLLGRWALNGLLIIVTLGIYGIWAPVRIQSWLTENTHFVD